MAGSGVDVEGNVDTATVRWGDGWAEIDDDDEAAAVSAVDTAAGDEGDLGGGCFGLCGVLLSAATDSCPFRIGSGVAFRLHNVAAELDFLTT